MKWGQVIVALLAVLLFGWVMAHMNIESMVQQLKAMRVAVPIVLALSAIRLYFQSLNWSASLKREHLSVESGKLAAVRVASQSMGYLTIFGPLISEPMKIKLLATPAEPTITATFLDDGVYWFTSGPDCPRWPPEPAVVDRPRHALSRDPRSSCVESGDLYHHAPQYAPFCCRTRIWQEGPFLDNPH